MNASIGGTDSGVAKCSLVLELGLPMEESQKLGMELRGRMSPARTAGICTSGGGEGTEHPCSIIFCCDCVDL